MQRAHSTIDRESGEEYICQTQNIHVCHEDRDVKLEVIRARDAMKLRAKKTRECPAQIISQVNFIVGAAVAAEMGRKTAIKKMIHKAHGCAATRRHSHACPH